jgi:hypothetical protein
VIVIEKKEKTDNDYDYAQRLRPALTNNLMPEYELSTHAKEMLYERGIRQEWVWRTIETGKSLRGEDGNLHYVKPIREKDGRVLHVVINPYVTPQRVVTVFFDRRLQK